jgi:hypothetical protein
MRRVQRREGWIRFTQDLVERTGIADKKRRYRVLCRLRAMGVFEVRRLNASGNKVEYRLDPNWAKPRAEVIELAAVRTARKRES